jgi:hypothetical protein
MGTMSAQRRMMKERGAPPLPPFIIHHFAPCMAASALMGFEEGHVQVISQAAVRTAQSDTILRHVHLAHRQGRRMRGETVAEADGRSPLDRLLAKPALDLSAAGGKRPKREPMEQVAGAAAEKDLVRKADFLDGQAQPMGGKTLLNKGAACIGKGHPTSRAPWPGSDRYTRADRPAHRMDQEASRTRASNARAPIP